MVNQDSVVDLRLNVYGVCELKVANLSIGPGNVCEYILGCAVIGEQACSIGSATIRSRTMPSSAIIIAPNGVSAIVIIVDIYISTPCHFGTNQVV